jgi:hypothetical protein
MKRASEVPVKRAYQPPKLIVYGDLTQLTMKNTGSTMDMATGNQKT